MCVDPISLTIERHAGLRQSDCLACDVCCRFPEPGSAFAPFFSNKEIEHACTSGLDRDSFPPGRFGRGHAALLVRRDAHFVCPAFDAPSNACRIYRVRPLDCRLYPYILMYEPDGGAIWLALDGNCPVLSAPGRREPVRSCALRLADLLEGTAIGEVEDCGGIVGEWKPHARPLVRLEKLSRVLCRNDLGLKRLTLSARRILAPYFEANAPALSMYAFASVHVWSCAFDIWWKHVGQRIVIVALGDGDCFMIVPPMGDGDPTEAATEGLHLIENLRPGGASPRIQEADESLKAALSGKGWRTTRWSVEYVCARKDLSELSGNRYEKKRQMCNRFERDNRWNWRPFASADLCDVVSLYRSWLSERCATHPEPFFTAQAEASFRCLIHALKNAEALGIVARVLEAGGRLVGVTAGTPLADGRSFFVMFEVADRSVRGAAQFMFRQFCRELEGFDWINMGGSSGLSNLERVKESYHPLLRPRAYVLAPDIHNSPERA